MALENKDGAVVIAIDADDSGFNKKVDGVESKLQSAGEKAQRVQEALSESPKNGISDAVNKINDDLADLEKRANEISVAISAANDAGADTANLEVAQYENLAIQLDAAREKLELLQSVQSKMDDVGSEAWTNRAIEIANTEAQIQRLNEAMTSSVSLMEQQIERNEQLKLEAELAYNKGTMSAEKYRAEIERLNAANDAYKAKIAEISSTQGQQKDAYTQLNDKMSQYDERLKAVKDRLGEISASAHSAKAAHTGLADETELARQKAIAIGEAVGLLNAKYAALKNEADGMKEALKLGDITQDQYDAFLRQLINTKAELENLKKTTGEYGDKAKEAGEQTSVFGDVLKANLASDAIEAGAKKLIQILDDIIQKTRELIDETKEAGDRIDKQSQILGVSREAYQKWDYVLSRNGANISNLATGTRTLTNEVEKAQNGTGKAAEAAINAFKAVGLSVDELGKLTREELFERVIYGLQSISDEQSRNIAANTLLGRSYTQLIPLLNQSAESTEALKQAAHENGMIMSDEAVDAAVKYKDALTTLEYTAKGFKENLISELLPGLTDELLPVAQDFLETLNDELPELKTSVLEFADKLYPKLEELEKKLLDFMTDKGLPAVLNALEWLIDNGDTVVGFAEALAATWAVGKVVKFGEALQKIPQLLTAATTALSGWVGVATVAVALAVELRNLIEQGRELLFEHSDAVNALDDEYIELNKTLERFNELKEKSLDLATREAAQSYDTAKAEAQRYKSQIDTYEKLLEKNREYYGQDNLNGAMLYNFDQSGNIVGEAGSFQEISDQLGSLYSDYYAANNIVKAYGETMAETTERAKKHIDETEEAAENAAKNVGKTTANVVDEIKTRRFSETEEALKSRISELDKKLKTHKVTEKEYYASLREMLDTDKYILGEDSELWHKYNDKYAEYIKKSTDAETKAAEKATKEACKALKERVKSQWQALENQHNENPTEFTDKWLLEEYKKILDTLDKESDLYREYYDKWLTLRDKIDKEEARKLEKQQKEIDKALQKSENATKTQLKNEASDIKKEFDSLVSAYKKSYDDIIKERDKYKNKLLGESIFSVTTERDKETGEEYKTFTIENIQAVLKARKDYAQQIAVLEKRGLAKGLMDELESLKPEDAAVFAKKLASMSDKEFDTINNSYKELDQMATDAAQERYADEIEALQTEFIDKAQSVFENASPDLKAAGISAIQAYMEGFDASKEDAFTDIKSFADGIVTEINRGLQDGSIKMTHTLDEMARESNVGANLVTGILDALSGSENEIQSKIEDIINQTQIDIKVRASMLDHSAAVSSQGYSAAQSTYSQFHTPVYGDGVQTPTATPQAETKTVYLLMDPSGSHILASAVETENKKNATVGGS